MFSEGFYLLNEFSFSLRNGLFQDPPDWTEILTHFRGSELQNYFTKILEDDLKAIIKPQYVDQIPKAVKVNSVGLFSPTTNASDKEQIVFLSSNGPV